MGRIIRRPFAVDNDVAVKAQVARYRELRDWKQGAEQEMRELQEKLGVTLDEHDALELTIGGVPVARRVSYTHESVSPVKLRAFHPRIARSMIKKTPVVTVTVP